MAADEQTPLNPKHAEQAWISTGTGFRYASTALVFDATHAWLVYFVWQSIANTQSKLNNPLENPFPVVSLLIVMFGEVASFVGSKLIFDVVNSLVKKYTDKHIFTGVSEHLSGSSFKDKYVPLTIEASFSGFFWQLISTASQAFTNKSGYENTLNAPRILSSLVLYSFTYIPVLAYLSRTHLKNSYDEFQQKKLAFNNKDDHEQRRDFRSAYITFLSLILKITCSAMGAFAFDMAGPAPYGSPASTRLNAVVDASYGALFYTFTGFFGLTSAYAYYHQQCKAVPTMHPMGSTI